MKNSVLLPMTISAIVASLTAAPALAGGQHGAEIPTTKSVVTLKDFDFFRSLETPPFGVGENPVGVAVDGKGNVLTGLLFTGDILEVKPGSGKSSQFSKLPIVNPVPPPPAELDENRDPIDPGCPIRPSGQTRTAFMTGFARHRRGDLYVGLPTCDSEVNIHGIWRVSRNGKKTEPFAPLPVQDLPKGLAFSKGGNFPLYVTNLHDFRVSRDECRDALGTPDACTLKIWSIDHKGNVTDWIEDPLLFGNPDSPLDHPHGVNGIVVDKKGKNVYVTITDFGRVLRIPINKDGSAGDPEIFFEEDDPPEDPEERDLFGMDGITQGPDGNFYIVIVRTDQLIAIPPDGSDYTEMVVGHPLDGPTQLVFGKGYYSRKSLPPLYITSGSGRRIFLWSLAAFNPNGLLEGVKELINFGALTEEEAIDLNPRPALVRVLLEADGRRRGY